MANFFCLMREKDFEKLVNQYSEPLYWQIRRLVNNHEDANDLLQNTFVKAWSKIDEFRNDAKISTWLYRIAINESIDFLRKQKNFNGVSTDAEDAVIANTLKSDPYFDGDDIQVKLQTAISLLPPAQKAVFNMRYFDEMPYSEISEITGTSEGALKASYHIAVQKISKYFKTND